MRGLLVKGLEKLLRFLKSYNPEYARAKELILWAETLRSHDKLVSGERKRNQVLNRLVSEFPDSRHKDLALLVEQVLQEI